MKQSGPDASAPTPRTGPEGREIVADTAAMLHREGRFFKAVEDAGHVVRDVAHHEAIEQSNFAVRSGTRQYSSSRQEVKVRHDSVKMFGPFFRIVFRFCQSRRDSAHRLFN
tara:strand:- start:223 stop:555 length:333 start_codon:yes stop_codon:yes gene_type:complete